MKSAMRSIALMAADHWNSHKTYGKIWLTIGLMGLIVDAALCYQYGVTQTTWHGLGFALVALVFSQLPDGAYSEYQKGNKAVAWVLAGLCIPMGAVAYQSHIGYGAGVRLGDIKKAAIQDANWTGAQDTANENGDNLKLWKTQLADLQKQAPWAATVTADGLRSQLQTAEEAIKQEEARGGCGKRCMANMKARDDISQRISQTERMADLTKQIEATQRLVDKYRQTASTTEAGFSSAAMQTTANSQLFGVLRAAWTGEPLEQALKVTENSSKLANLIITAAGSLAFMLMAPIGFFMAGRNRRTGEDFEEESRKELTSALASKADAKKDAKGNTVFNISALDDKAKEALSKYVASLQQNRQLYGGAAA